MFKDQIVSALKTKYKNFGLSNEAIDRIASAMEKTVTEASQIETVIANAETMGLIASELQKMRDREIQSRTDTQRAFDAYKLAHPENDTTPPPPVKEDPKGLTLEDITKLLDEKLNPLSEKITGIENSRSAKAAHEAAKALFFGGDYAKKYKDQADESWERAVELNEATGSKMTAEELSAKASSYFNKAVGKLGVDTSKPFVADPDPTHEKGTMDWSKEKERQQKRAGVQSAS